MLESGFGSGFESEEDDFLDIIFSRSRYMDDTADRTNVPRPVQQLMNLMGRPAKDLSVYQNVPLEDLIPTGRERPEIDRSLEKQRLRYVLCQGRRVILAEAPWDTFGCMGRRSPRLDADSIPGLLVIKNTQILRYPRIVRKKMEETAENPTGPGWRYHPHPVPARELVRLCHKKLLETWNPGDLPGKTFYSPTNYGWDMGLSMAYTLGHDTLHCVPICPPERIEALKQPWRPDGAGRCAVQAARQLACVPLFRCLAGRPADLEELTAGLKLQPDGTFQQTAVSISQLLNGNWFQAETGRDMLRLLGAAVRPNSSLQAAGESVTALFRGFGAMTGEGWPEWAAQQLLKECENSDAPTDVTYGELVQWARNAEEELDDVPANLLFRLLVQPMLFLSVNEVKSKKYER